jgi:hypothetical protein
MANLKSELGPCWTQKKKGTKDTKDTKGLRPEFASVLMAIEGVFGPRAQCNEGEACCRADCAREGVLMWVVASACSASSFLSHSRAIAAALLALSQAMHDLGFLFG